MRHIFQKKKRRKPKIPNIRVHAFYVRTLYVYNNMSGNEKELLIWISLPGDWCPNPEQKQKLVDDSKCGLASFQILQIGPAAFIGFQTWVDSFKGINSRRLLNSSPKRRPILQTLTKCSFFFPTGSKYWKISGLDVLLLIETIPKNANVLWLKLIFFLSGPELFLSCSKAQIVLLYKTLDY